MLYVVQLTYLEGGRQRWGPFLGRSFSLSLSLSLSLSSLPSIITRLIPCPIRHVIPVKLSSFFFSYIHPQSDFKIRQLTMSTMPTNRIRALSPESNIAIYHIVIIIESFDRSRLHITCGLMLLFYSSLFSFP